MTYSLDIINLFLEYYLSDISIKEISKRLNIHIQTLYKWVNNYDLNITKKIPVTNRYKYSSSKECKNNKSLRYENKVIEFVNKNIGCCLNDIYNSVNKEISLSTICRILKKNKLTRKKINHKTITKDITLLNNERSEFSKNLNISEFMNAIHLDEVHFNINDTIRYGYSKAGQEIKKISKHSKNKESRSVILATSINGIQCGHIYKSSINSHMFLTFLKRNIDIFMNRIVYLDNCSIHTAKIVKSWCLENNIKLRFNPTYFPESNPIENLFSKTKTNFRKKNHDDIEKDINEAIQTITSHDCYGCYRHAVKEIKKY